MNGGRCIECNRTLEDIERWGSMSQEERIERMQELLEK